MACCGQHLKSRPSGGSPRAANTVSPQKDRVIVPYSQCVFCAEKHLSDAWDLAREVGYEFPNRQTIIGALGSAERHLVIKWNPLAEKIRAARHLVQLREESKVEWKPLLAEIDALASEAAKNLKAENKATTEK